MSSKNEKDDNDTQPRASHDAVVDEKPELQGGTHTKEVAAASVALEAVIAEQKPKMFSKGMTKLWLIMGIGYLVSTMNGFGAPPMTLSNIPSPCCTYTQIQTVPSWVPSMP